MPLKAAGLSGDSVDRVLMNPPFHDARRQNVSPDPRRRLAHVGAPGLLARWVDTAAWLLKSRGVLTLIWRADGLDDVLGALRPVFGDIAVLPVLPRAGAPAIRVLVRAVKAGSGTQMDLSCLLHSMMNMASRRRLPKPYYAGEKRLILRRSRRRGVSA